MRVIYLIENTIDNIRSYISFFPYQLGIGFTISESDESQTSYYVRFHPPSGRHRVFREYLVFHVHVVTIKLCLWCRVSFARNHHLLLAIHPMNTIVVLSIDPVERLKSGIN